MQKYETYLSFLSENFQFLEIKFSIYLNRRVFVMLSNCPYAPSDLGFPVCMCVYVPKAHFLMVRIQCYMHKGRVKLVMKVGFIRFYEIFMISNYTRQN